MIKLLSVAIVAGLLCESSQQTLAISKKAQPFRFSWYYPFHTLRWTRWYDRDNPSGTGDWELLSNLRKENPGQICSKPVQMEVRTVYGLSVAAAGDRIYKNHPTVGFVCRNRDQHKKKCNDYRVRFRCRFRRSFCSGGVRWTRWYDRDNPSGTGDWELLSTLRKEYPGQICKQPLYIEAVTTDTMTPATKTGEIFYYYSPTVGFSCRRADQKWKRSCRDYKVRFGCPCKY